MRVYCAKDYDGLCRKAANILSAQVILKPNSVLGPATGSTPLGIYRQLIDWHRKGDLDFSCATTFNLDEYRGIAPENPQSYHYYMVHNFFRHVNVPASRIHIPNGTAEDGAAECARYESLLAECGGIDMQLLGIGRNGHIGFNEPSSQFESSTFVVDLSESTIKANARFFSSESEMPRQAYTMGMRSIMQAKRIVLAVSGGDKANIVREAFCGPITAAVPASVLQLHNNVDLVGDEDALALLPPEKDGYS